VLPVEELHIHEEIVPELLEKLLMDMKSGGVVKDPVVVDAKTRVVLDGMHRVAASKKLGFSYLPVCSVDYLDPKIKIGCWYRVASGRSGQVEDMLGLFRIILALLGLDVKPSSFEDAKRMLDERRATAAVLTAKSCHLITAKSTSMPESYSWITRVERVLREEGFSISYVSEEDALHAVELATIVMMVPCVRKEEVIDVTGRGKVFAHKTTRHVLPLRPVNINVPVGWLKGEKSLNEVNRMFVEILSKQKIKRLPGGSIFGGRRYNEELLVFEGNV
jgi:hypothetical protein